MCKRKPTPQTAWTFTGTRARSSLRALWLSSKVKNLRMIVAKDGYVPQTRTFKVKAGRSTRLDYTLQHTGC